jgi:hypothetical protein
MFFDVRSAQAIVDAAIAALVDGAPDELNTLRKLALKRVSIKNTNYTFESEDQGGLVGLDSSSNRTFTIPNEATVNFPVGTEIQVATLAGGHLTIAAASPATVVAKNLTMNQQYSTGRIVKIGADSWFFCAV